MKGRMEHWLKELRESADKKSYPKGSLLEEMDLMDDDRVYYGKGDDDITLYGCFSIEELETIIEHVRSCNDD